MINWKINNCIVICIQSSIVRLQKRRQVNTLLTKFSRIFFTPGYVPSFWRQYLFLADLMFVNWLQVVCADIDKPRKHRCIVLPSDLQTPLNLSG